MHARPLTVRIGMVLMLAGALLVRSMPSAANASPPSGEPTATLFVTGLEVGTGSTIGPDEGLYVTEGTAGRIWRVDPQTGQRTLFASGLPPTVDPNNPFGGAVDIAFLGKTAYVLVTLVGPDVGGSAVVGI